MWHNRKEDVVSAPSVLIISLLRYGKTRGGGYVKNRQQIYPSQNLRFQKKKYEKKSVMTHSGTQRNQGHILTTIEVQGEYVTINDSTIGKDRNTPMDGYVFVYEEISDDKIKAADDKSFFPKNVPNKGGIKINVGQQQFHEKVSRDDIKAADDNSFLPKNVSDDGGIKINVAQQHFQEKNSEDELKDADDDFFFLKNVPDGNGIKINVGQRHFPIPKCEELYNKLKSTRKTNLPHAKMMCKILMKVMPKIQFRQCDKLKLESDPVSMVLMDEILLKETERLPVKTRSGKFNLSNAVLTSICGSDESATEINLRLMIETILHHEKSGNLNDLQMFDGKGYVNFDLIETMAKILDIEIVCYVPNVSKKNYSERKFHSESGEKGLVTLLLTSTVPLGKDYYIHGQNTQLILF